MLVTLSAALACVGQPWFGDRANVRHRAAACTSDGWDDFARGFFVACCNDCHESVYAQYRNVAMLAWSIEDTIVKGRMPPPDSGVAMDANTRGRILQWLRCKTPEHAQE